MSELDTHIIMLVRGEHRYIYVWDDREDRRKLLSHIAGQASNPALNIDWHDAAKLAQKLRKQ